MKSHIVHIDSHHVGLNFDLRPIQGNPDRLRVQVYGAAPAGLNQAEALDHLRLQLFDDGLTSQALTRVQPEAPDQRHHSSRPIRCELRVSDCTGRLRDYLRAHLTHAQRGGRDRVTLLSKYLHL
jgi:hypothetical protein